MLRPHAPAVGDVLLLQPLGPGRLGIQLVKGGSEVGAGGACVHAAHVAEAVMCRVPGPARSP